MGKTQKTKQNQNPRERGGFGESYKEELFYVVTA